MESQGMQGHALSEDSKGRLFLDFSSLYWLLAVTGICDL